MHRREIVMTDWQYHSAEGQENDSGAKVHRAPEITRQQLSQSLYRNGIGGSTTVTAGRAWTHGFSRKPQVLSCIEFGWIWGFMIACELICKLNVAPRKLEHVTSWTEVQRVAIFRHDMRCVVVFVILNLMRRHDYKCHSKELLSSIKNKTQSLHVKHVYTRSKLTQGIVLLIGVSRILTSHSHLLSNKKKTWSWNVA